VPAPDPNDVGRLDQLGSGVVVPFRFEGAIAVSGRPQSSRCDRCQPGRRKHRLNHNFIAQCRPGQAILKRARTLDSSRWYMDSLLTFLAESEQTHGGFALIRDYLRMVIACSRALYGSDLCDLHLITVDLRR
jgi:hypothetical protein